MAPGEVTEAVKGIAAAPESARVAWGWEGLERSAPAAAAQELQEHPVLGEQLVEAGLEEQVHQRVVEHRGLGKDSREHKGQRWHLAGIPEQRPQRKHGIGGPGSQEPQAHGNAQLEKEQMEMEVPSAACSAQGMLTPPKLSHMQQDPEQPHCSAC